MLEIMRDSRLGTHGGLALIFVLVAKVLVVGELLLRDTTPSPRWRRPAPSVAGWRCC
jgi:cobalamin synthase